MCVRILPACMHTTWMHHAHRAQKKVLDPLELELWVLVSHYVGAGNRVQVLCKSNKSSKPMTCLCWSITVPFSLLFFIKIFFMQYILIMLFSSLNSPRSSQPPLTHNSTPFLSLPLWKKQKSQPNKQKTPRHQYQYTHTNPHKKWKWKYTSKITLRPKKVQTKKFETQSLPNTIEFILFWPSNPGHEPLPWSVVNVPSDIPLERTNFTFPNRY